MYKNIASLYYACETNITNVRHISTIFNKKINLKIKN